MRRCRVGANALSSERSKFKAPGGSEQPSLPTGVSNFLYPNEKFPYGGDHSTLAFLKKYVASGLRGYPETGPRLAPLHYLNRLIVAMIDRALAPYGDHVISPGWLGDSARNAYLALADVVVMPSQLEYFPYSILEPMIAGRAIVSAEVGGVPEMIHGGKECLFYPPTHAVQLSEHILRLLDNGALARTLAASARARALESYQWSTIARQYMDMYASVLC